MFRNMFLIVSMCNFIHCSEVKREDIVLGEVKPRKSISDSSLSDGHHNHWGSEKHTYNEQHREHLPDHLIHHASTSIVSQRVGHGAVDLPGVQRVVSDDSIPGTTVNVAATIAVKTDSECCNSHCCIDEDTTCRCSIQ